MRFKCKAKPSIGCARVELLRACCMLWPLPRHTLSVSCQLRINFLGALADGHEYSERSVGAQCNCSKPASIRSSCQHCQPCLLCLSCGLHVPVGDARARQRLPLAASSGRIPSARATPLILPCKRSERSRVMLGPLRWLHTEQVCFRRRHGVRLRPRHSPVNQAQLQPCSNVLRVICWLSLMVCAEHAFVYTVYWAGMPRTCTC